MILDDFFLDPDEGAGEENAFSLYLINFYYFSFNFSYFKDNSASLVYFL